MRDGSHDLFVTSIVNLMLTLRYSVDKFGSTTFVSSAARLRDPLAAAKKSR